MSEERRFWLLASGATRRCGQKLELEARSCPTNKNAGLVGPAHSCYSPRGERLGSEVPADFLHTLGHRLHVTFTSPAPDPPALVAARAWSSLTSQPGPRRPWLL